MNLDQLAQDLLDAAVSSGVTVDRAFIASAPGWAEDCRQIVVHLSPIRVVDAIPQGRGPSLGMCAWVPQVVATVSFVDDCVPVPSEDGQPPSPDAITAHSLQWYADTEAIWQALSGWIGDQPECANYRIGESIHSGPLGQAVKVQIPIQVTPTDEIPLGS